MVDDYGTRTQSNQWLPGYPRELLAFSFNESQESAR
jgi:hypothetical protein